MKRQKSPVVLVTVLLLVVGLALGARFFNPNALQSAGQQTPDAVAGDTRITEAEEDIKNRIKASTAGLDTGGAAKPSAEVGPLAEASILEPETSIYKPTPNDSTVSTHWYSENSRKAEGN